MYPDDDRRRRLLSHRLRGFAEHESTLKGMHAALGAGVQHVEFDVRVTRDGTLIAYHDPYFQTDDGAWQQVDEWDLKDLHAQSRMRHVPTAADMVARFAADMTPQSFLHVDVKVVGQADTLIAILAAADVLNRTVLVSWVPAVLQEFNRQAPTLPVCFSHVSFARAPSLYGVAKQIARPGLRRIAARGLKRLSPHASAALSTARLDFADDGDPSVVMAPEDRAGRNHIHVVPGLLSGRMLSLLKATNGFACLPGWCAQRALVSQYQKLGVRVALFAAGSAAVLEQLLATDADIIYVDHPGLFA